MGLPIWLGDAVRMPVGLRRRELLELIALVAALPACKGRREEPAPPPPAPAPPPTALDRTSYRTLEAVVARILPADGDFPGARETGAITFIDRQLAIAPLSRIAPALIAFATLLGGFADLPDAQQDAMLERAAHGQLGSQLPEAVIFRILHGLVLEGFLCDPVHGGNHDERGWKAIGFATPTLRHG